MPDIAAELLSFTTRDHERGCAGREYVCSCGYDTGLEAAVKRAADLITTLTAAIADDNKEMRRLNDENDRLRTEIEELKGVLRADAERLRIAGDRVDLATGCDTADAMADEIERLRSELDDLDVALEAEKAWKQRLLLALKTAHAEGMEEAARVADSYVATGDEYDDGQKHSIASAIRKAKENNG